MSHDNEVLPRQVNLAGFRFAQLTELEVVDHVMRALAQRRGGWIATPNIDICSRSRRDPASRSLVESASLIVPDGMPIVWASRLAGMKLPERVTGSSLIFSLTGAAARNGYSIYVLGGAAGVPEEAARVLRSRYPVLEIAGANSPPLGFDSDYAKLSGIREMLASVDADIVYVGLGFPKQERVISFLTAELPTTWFVGCGAAIPFAAGAVRRAPHLIQRLGMEWAYRLLLEPRRLFGRYIVRGVPYGVFLLVLSAYRGTKVRYIRRRGERRALYQGGPSSVEAEVRSSE